MQSSGPEHMMVAAKRVLRYLQGGRKSLRYNIYQGDSQNLMSLLSVTAIRTGVGGKDTRRDLLPGFLFMLDSGLVRAGKAS